MSVPPGGTRLALCSLESMETSGDTSWSRFGMLSDSAVVTYSLPSGGEGFFRFGLALCHDGEPV